MCILSNAKLYARHRKMINYEKIYVLKLKTNHCFFTCNENVPCLVAGVKDGGLLVYQVVAL